MAVEIKKINGVYMGSQEIASTRFAGDANLVGYWRFEGNSLDETTNNNDGTDTSISYGTDYGKFGQGASFGGSSKIVLPDVAGFNPANISVSFWLKSTQASDYIHLVSNCLVGGSNYYGYYVGMMTDNIRFQLFYGDTTNTPLDGNKVINDGNWHYITATFDGTTQKIYVDGSLDNSRTSSAISYGGTAAPGIGAYIVGDSNKYVGYLDDVAIFSRALSSDEIYSLYKTGVKKLNGQVNLNPELESTSLRGDANLQAYWKLENTDDETTNNRDLTNTGTVAFNAGKFGNCADTGASNSTKKLTVASNCGVAGGNISINIWFNAYAATFAGDHPPLISCFSDQTGGAGVAYGIGINTTGLFAFRLKSGVAWQETAASAISASTWYMATMTYDGTNCKLYINGEYVSQVAASGNGSTGYYADQTALFCHAGYTTDTFTSAKIDDAGIFNDVLTAQEISNLYNTNIKKYNSVSNV